MDRIAIIGAASVAQQMAHYLKEDRGYCIAGFFDDKIPSGTMTEHGEVLGTTEDVLPLYENDRFEQLLIGIGYMYFEYRWECFQRFRGIIPFHTFVHSSCFVDSTTRIGDGSFLMPGCIIDNEVQILDNTFLQIACSISHHSIIGENCFLAPGVRVAGCVKIERNCFLGIGTICIDSTTVGSNIRTGGGTVITDSLQDAGLYVGAPARKIK